MCFVLVYCVRHYATCVFVLHHVIRRDRHLHHAVHRRTELYVCLIMFLCSLLNVLAFYVFELICCVLILMMQGYCVLTFLIHFIHDELVTLSIIYDYSFSCPGAQCKC